MPRRGAHLLHGIDPFLCSCCQVPEYCLLHSRGRTTARQARASSAWLTSRPPDKYVSEASSLTKRQACAVEPVQCVLADQLLLWMMGAQITATGPSHNNTSLPHVVAGAYHLSNKPLHDIPLHFKRSDKQSDRHPAPPEASAVRVPFWHRMF